MAFWTLHRDEEVFGNFVLTLDITMVEASMDEDRWTAHDDNGRAKFKTPSGGGSKARQADPFFKTKHRTYRFEGYTESRLALLQKEFEDRQTDVA